MKQKAYIKPTKPGLIVGIIVIIAFLAFGIFFFSLLSGEPEAYIGQTFLVIWIIIVLVIGGVFVNNLGNVIGVDSKIKTLFCLVTTYRLAQKGDN